MNGDDQRVPAAELSPAGVSAAGLSRAGVSRAGVSAARFSIGEVARRTGLSVKTIRFYADAGIVAPTGRTAGGYRLYDDDALARLDLIRTLRDLGLDLAAARSVTDRETSLPEVAAAHAEALTAQIRELRLRRAVLRAVAKLCDTPEELELVHQLARLGADERRRLSAEFFDAVFGGLRPEPGVVRSLTPELPDDPGPDQVEAWVELAGLSRDPDFRASVRRMAERYAAERTGLRPGAVALVRDLTGFAASAGLDPALPECDGLVEAVVTRYAATVGEPDGPGLRRRLAAALRSANDPRWQRYLDLLAVINGWQRQQSINPVLDWFLAALAARGQMPTPA
jgi:DNA-binding transcriptional MerR regulator